MREKLPLIILLFCLIQPVLDIAGYWQNRLGISNTATMAARMLLLGGSVLLGFFLSDRKRYYFAAAAVMLLLTAGHIWACCMSPNGYEEAITDLVNIVRIYFLPMTTLCFITFLRQNEKAFSAMQKGMVLDILIIACVQLVSELTGTNPYTYSADSIGILGWYMWTNSQSAILAMLCPIAICWCISKSRDRIIPVVLLTIVCEATLYVLAPRLSYGSLIGCGVGTCVCLLIINRKKWKQALAVLLITALFVAAYPLSPTSARLAANQRRAEKAKEQVDALDIVIPTAKPHGKPEETEETGSAAESTETETAETETAETETAETAETETNPTETEPVSPAEPDDNEVILDGKTAKELEVFYRSHDLMWSMISRFGRDRVFRIYNYTLDPTILGNTRLMKINFCILAMEDAGLPSKLFGLDLKDMTQNRYNAKSELVTDNYDVENDFHGVYFLTGIVGLTLMILFLLYFGVRALIAVIRKPKVYFNLTMASFAMAYGLGLIHAYFTASVLRRNNASVYLAMVLAGLWYLSRKQLQTEPEAKDADR